MRSHFFRDSIKSLQLNALPRRTYLPQEAFGLKLGSVIRTGRMHGACTIPRSLGHRFSALLLFVIAFIDILTFMFRILPLHFFFVKGKFSHLLRFRSVILEKLYKEFMAYKNIFIIFVGK